MAMTTAGRQRGTATAWLLSLALLLPLVLPLLLPSSASAESAIAASQEQSRCSSPRGGASSTSGSVCSKIMSGTRRRAVCAANGLSDVPSDIPNSDLVELRLEKNCIKNLHENSFTNYPDLEHINLERNALEDITEGAFKPLKNLQRLDISKNYLRIFSNLFLRPLTKLKELHMGNPQIVLEDGFFKAQKETLEILDLQGTGDLVIKEGAFSGLNRLKELDLRGCNLKTLPNTGLMQKDLSAMSLQNLSMGGNKWECDCHLRWLMEWYKLKINEAHKDIFFGTVTCAGPPEDQETRYAGMVGKRLFHPATQSTQFQCQPQVFATGTKTEHKVPQGSNVTMSCQFFSDPKGDTVWLFGENTPSTRITYQKGYHAWQSKDSVHFEATLTITSVQEKDQGVYMCTVNNERGSASLKHRLIVDTTKSAMLNRRLVTVVSIGAVIVITCALMIGGVFFYHYTRNSPRSGGGGGAVAVGVAGGGGGRKAPPSYAQQASYSQLQNRGGGGGGGGGRGSGGGGIVGVAVAGENGYTSGAATIDGKKRAQYHQQQQQHPLIMDTQQQQQQHELLFEPPGYMTIRSPVNRPTCEGTLPHQHQHGPCGECPVHGSRQFVGAPCPVHGQDASRSGTPQQQQQHQHQHQHQHGTLPGAKPCPLHGDLYATIAKTSTSATSSGNPPLPPPPVDPALLRQRMQLQQQQPATSVPIGSTPGGTYVRASKVDDCIPEGAAVVSASAAAVSLASVDLPPPPPPPHPQQQQPLQPLVIAQQAAAVAMAQRIGGQNKPNAQDDEGYSTAV